MNGRNNLFRPGCKLDFHAVVFFRGLAYALRTLSALLDYFPAMMFKIFSLGLLLFSIVGCQTGPPLSPVNLNEPAWKIREGQAVWTTHRGEPGIAGDLTVAIRGQQEAFAQFNKGPFQIVVAQRTSSAWSAEFPGQHKHYTGPGLPPNRLIFLLLPRLLAGEPAPRGWSWQEPANNNWRLENQSTGESLEGYLSP
jgi:hypothetical protein